MKDVYGYIRVSTPKQGKGVSLEVQKSSIESYALNNNLKIINWFVEKKTASKQGRELFNKMIKLLSKNKGVGVIVHKIDRSARNLQDWALVSKLLDIGVDVRFSHESIDLTTRGGRLLADFQAVIASDYSRNLSQEAKKGLYGRLEQGVYPFRAPVGYLNNGGGGTEKTIDSTKAPIIKKIFERYSKGDISYKVLVKYAEELGLTNISGKKIKKDALTRMLNNPFYIGLMQVKGKTYKGLHKTFISVQLFNKVKEVLRGKTQPRARKHSHVFSRLIKCNNCKHSLIGSMQKGKLYYRCHTKECPTKTIREDRLEASIYKYLKTLKIDGFEHSLISKYLNIKDNNFKEESLKLSKSLLLQMEQVVSKTERLTDALIDGNIDKETFAIKKKQLEIHLIGIQEKIDSNKSQKSKIIKKLNKILELIKSPINIYNSATLQERRELVKILTSNLYTEGRNLLITRRFPFSLLSQKSHSQLCALNQDDTQNKCNKIVAADFKNEDIENLVYISEFTSAIIPPKLTKEQWHYLIDYIIEVIVQNPEMDFHFNEFEI